MSDTNFEQRFVISFCFRLGHSALEMFAKIWQACRDKFCRAPRCFGSLRYFQKEENQLKMNLAAEGLRFQELVQISTESGILCMQIISWQSELVMGAFECKMSKYSILISSRGLSRTHISIRILAFGCSHSPVCSLSLSLTMRSDLICIHQEVSIGILREAVGFIALEIFQSAAFGDARFEYWMLYSPSNHYSLHSVFTLDSRTLLIAKYSLFSVFGIHTVLENSCFTIAKYSAFIFLSALSERSESFEVYRMHSLTLLWV